MTWFLKKKKKKEEKKKHLSTWETLYDRICSFLVTNKKNDFEMNFVSHQNSCFAPLSDLASHCSFDQQPKSVGERGCSVVECRTPEREVRGSRPTAAVLCPWARHFTPRKYWLITQEAMAPSRHDWKIVDWDVRPQHNQPTKISQSYIIAHFIILCIMVCMSWCSIKLFIIWRRCYSVDNVMS